MRFHSCGTLLSFFRRQSLIISETFTLTLDTDPNPEADPNPNPCSYPYRSDILKHEGTLKALSKQEASIQKEIKILKVRRVIFNREPYRYYLIILLS